MDLNINPSKIGKRVRLDVSYTNKDEQTLTASAHFSVTKEARGIYGVEWSGSGHTLTRTDDAINFLDPVPFINDGSHPGFSPFDDIMPWSGMVRETIDGNVMVKIPKFWYKITTNEDKNVRKIQIANYPVNGFLISPAHRDRGDGEKDYIYVARYPCNSSYKSRSHETPITSIKREEARASIRALGNNYQQFDYSLWVTIWLLYIVEFANWDCQDCIGADFSSGVSKTGYSDYMTYHTGTWQSSKTAYANGVQYRNIEGLWGSVFIWCDGITFNGKDIYCFENFADYSEDYTSSGAILVGTQPSSQGLIEDFTISLTEDFKWFMYPSSCWGYDRNIPDMWEYGSNSKVLRIGGSASYTSNGLFKAYAETNWKWNTVSARLQYVPSN